MEKYLLLNVKRLPKCSIFLGWSIESCSNTQTQENVRCLGCSDEHQQDKLAKEAWAVPQAEAWGICLNAIGFSLR